MAARYGLPTGQLWPETAQAYLGKFPHDRHGLITFVADHCAGPQVKPGPLHEAIARAGFRAIVTAWYDDLLERALAAAGCRVNRIVRDTQLAFAQEGEREAIVVKLYGCLSDPESLVLTTWDHRELMYRLSRKLEVVTAFCALRPPLFAGFDLTDDMPMDLYVRASTNMVEHMRRIYAVWPQALDPVQAAWQGKNIELVQADAAAFLAALASQLPGVTATGRGAIRVQRAPVQVPRLLHGRGRRHLLRPRHREPDRDAAAPLVSPLHPVRPLGLRQDVAAAGRRRPPPGRRGLPAHLRARPGRPAGRAAPGHRHARRPCAGARRRRSWSCVSFLETMLAPTDKLVVILDQFEELFLRVGSARARDLLPPIGRRAGQPAARGARRLQPA